MRIVPSLLCISSFLFANHALAQTAEAPGEPLDAVMCTMDVMQCPDGSYVGRTGPQCEFVCPTGTDTPTVPPTLVSDPAPAGEVSTSDTVNQFEENRAARQDLREDRRIVLSEIRQQRIINLAANISNRMDAAVNRHFAIITRLESRLQKLELNGTDTSAARRSLQEAARTAAEARGLLSDIDAKVYAATTSDDAYTAWQELRAHYQSIAALIRDTQVTLRKTIALLKNPQPVPISQPAVGAAETATDTTIALPN